MSADLIKITEAALALKKGINGRWNKGDVDGAPEVAGTEMTCFDPMTEVRLDGRKALEAHFRRLFEGKRNIVGDAQDREKPGSPWNATQLGCLIESLWQVIQVTGPCQTTRPCYRP